MEIIESIMWFSVGLLPTFVALEVAWKVGKASDVRVPSAARKGKMGVKIAYA